MRTCSWASMVWHACCMSASLSCISHLVEIRFFYISTTIQNAVKPRCSPRADLGWCFPHAPFTLNSHPDALSYLMLPGLLFPKNWKRIPYRLGNPPGYSMHRTVCSLLPPSSRGNDAEDLVSVPNRETALSSPAGGARGATGDLPCITQHIRPTKTPGRHLP